MKINRIILLVVLGAFMIGCERNNTPQISQNKATEINVSGQVQGGYRHIPLKISGEKVELMVYRGDYLKFHLDDEGDDRDEYQLIIPGLSINTILKDNTGDQPYFKMKNRGEYPFTLGERSGVITVVELSQSNYAELSAGDAWKMLNDNPPFILDVRTRGEFNRGYIEGAELIPLQELQRRTAELEMYKNQAILIYCATGNRSTTASKILLDRGFKNVMNLRRGIVDWAGKGYSVKL